MVSNDDKRQNGKGDIVYLFINLMTNAANSWETSLGCRHNHVKPLEGDEVVKNDVKLVREED